jgi:proline dehydrogenase
MALVRKAAAQFMPGERVEDALAAADALGKKGIHVVLTELGENVTDLSTADASTRDYLEVLAMSAARGLGCHISVKLTQLGLDVDQGRCEANLRTLAREAAAHGTFVWIDMEQHEYVDDTLQLYRRALADFRNVGVCLQAYLYRTADDLASLIPLGAAVRLVKGAYRESSHVAFGRRREVDQNFLTLGRRMLRPAPNGATCRAVFATHDARLIHEVLADARGIAISPDAFEFHFLYGIQQRVQEWLHGEGFRIRILISYGKEWFPWYMRRLAERPANIVLVARAMMSR